MRVVARDERVKLELQARMSVSALGRRARDRVAESADVLDGDVDDIAVLKVGRRVHGVADAVRRAGAHLGSSCRIHLLVRRGK